jgi:hypothetical protein
MKLFQKCRSGKRSPDWGLVPMGIGKGYRRVNAGECYVLMYENGKMRHVETIQECGKWSLKETDGGDEFNYDILLELL